jgi:hypothetical protein
LRREHENKVGSREKTKRKMAENDRNGWEERACARIPPRILHEKWSENDSLKAKKRTENDAFKTKSRLSPKY